MPQRASFRVRRHRIAIAVAGLTTAAALGIGAASPGSAGAAPKNTVPSYTTVQHGCASEGFRLSTTSPEGFFLAHGTHGGACSISGPWGVPVLHGAQGRLTYTPPSGSRIALWNLHIEAAGQGSPPVSTEIYANDPGGEYQVHSFSTGTYNGQVDTSANHPDGAHSMFFLMRSHQQHTQNSGWYRHANIHGGRIDLYDLERPTLSGVSVDGGPAWSSSATRIVRWTGDDNLGNKGVDRYKVRAGSTVFYDSGTAGGTTGAKSRSINIGSLPDGAHSLTVTAESAGSGNLGDTVSASQAVRIDRTAPTLSPLGALPPSVTGDLTVGLNASDAHSGIRDVSIERAVPGGWETVHTATSNFGSIAVKSGSLQDGVHELRAVVMDEAGNTGSLALGSVEVSNTPHRTDAQTISAEPEPVQPGPVAEGNRIVGLTPPATGPQPERGARLVLDGPRELEAANPEGKRVTLHAKRAVPLFVVRYPRPSPISIGGHFVQSDGAPIPGHPIALVEAGVVRDWARTDASGRVRFTYRALRTGALRLRWGGNRGQDPILTSAAVKVIGRLGVRVRTRVRDGGALEVRGRTIPGVRRQLLVLERLNTTRCRSWRHVIVNGRTLSSATRGTRAARRAPSRCWDTAGKARTRKRGLFKLQDRRLPPLRLASGATPRSYEYAAYVRVRGLNTISKPVRVIVRR